MQESRVSYQSFAVWGSINMWTPVWDILEASKYFSHFLSRRKSSSWIYHLFPFPFFFLLSSTSYEEKMKKVTKYVCVHVCLYNNNWHF